MSPGGRPELTFFRIIPCRRILISEAFPWSELLPWEVSLILYTAIKLFFYFIIS